MTANSSPLTGTVQKRMPTRTQTATPYTTGPLGVIKKIEKMRIITTLLINLSTIQGIYAQQIDSSRTVQKRNFILSTGYTHLRMLDKQVYPLLYKANTVPLTINCHGSFQLKTPNSQQTKTNTL
jgi:hypothetical protein